MYTLSLVQHNKFHESLVVYKPSTCCTAIMQAEELTRTQTPSQTSILPSRSLICSVRVDSAALSCVTVARVSFIPDSCCWSSVSCLDFALAAVCSASSADLATASLASASCKKAKTGPCSVRSHGLAPNPLVQWVHLYVYHAPLSRPSTPKNKHPTPLLSLHMSYQCCMTAISGPLTPAQLAWLRQPRLPAAELEPSQC